MGWVSTKCKWSLSTYRIPTFTVQRAEKVYSYWDYPFDSHNYSYVNVAVDQYYFFTIAIDRPGIGSSSIEDPLKALQMPVELSVIYEMTKMLRNSALQDVPYSFCKIIHVGHSFGSSLLYNLAGQYPTASDGLILTGFSLSEAYVGTAIAGFDTQIASLNQPLRFGTQGYAAITETLAVLAAANETLAFIKQRVTDLAGVDLLDRMMKILNYIKKQVYRSLLIYIRVNIYSVK